MAKREKKVTYSQALHLVHLEDPAGSGLAACDGQPIPLLPHDGTAKIMQCPGCILREQQRATRSELDALKKLVRHFLDRRFAGASQKEITGILDQLARSCGWALLRSED